MQAVRPQRYIFTQRTVWQPPFRKDDNSRDSHGRIFHLQTALPFGAYSHDSEHQHELGQNASV